MDFIKDGKREIGGQYWQAFQWALLENGEKLEGKAGLGNGNPLRFSCLENSVDGGAWRAAVRGVHRGSDPTEHACTHTRGQREDCFCFLREIGSECGCGYWELQGDRHIVLWDMRTNLYQLGSFCWMKKPLLPLLFMLQANLITCFCFSASVDTLFLHLNCFLLISSGKCWMRLGSSAQLSVCFLPLNIKCLTPLFVSSVSSLSGFIAYCFLPIIFDDLHY